MISPVKSLAVAAAALFTGSIAQAGHAPAMLPPAVPSTAYSAPANCPSSHDVVVGAPAVRGTAVDMYAAPAPAAAPGVIHGSTGQVYGSGHRQTANARANVGGSGAYVYLGHSVGDGVGYDDGYSLFGAFVPLANTARGDGIWFAQGQYMLLQDHGFEGDSAFGIGLGRRQVVGNGVLSAAAFYDWDSRFGDYDQLGFNIGYQGCRFSVFGNYYNVLDDDNTTLSQHVSHTQFVANDGAGANGTTPYAGGHPGYNVGLPGGTHPNTGGFDNLAQDITTQGITGLDGFDVNFGYLLLPSKCDCCRGLRATAGFYGYRGHGIDDFYGARGGLIYDANPNFLLGAQLQGDDQFGTTVNATAIWTPCRRTPSQCVKVCCGTDSCGRPIYSRRNRVRSPFLYDLVQRQNRVALARTSNVERVFLSDPKTGERYRVVSVSNNGHADYDRTAPEGTSQNPYATIADVEAFSGQDDILFVHGGSDFNENLTLKTGQDVIGEGSTRVFHSVEHGDFSLGTVTGDTSRSIIGSAANIGVGGDAINVGEGHVIIDRVLTRGDIDANTIADGRLEISDTIVDCGQIRVSDYQGGAMFDGSVTLTGVRVFTEAGSTATALDIDNIGGDLVVTKLDQDGLAAFNDDWFTLNLAAPNDNWDGRNGFFATDAPAASVTNVGGNVVFTRSVFNSTSLPVAGDPGFAGSGAGGVANVLISGTNGVHLANNDFANQLINLENVSFLENVSYHGSDLFAVSTIAGPNALIEEALFGMGNTNLSAGTVEVLANPIDAAYIPPVLGASVNPNYYLDGGGK